MCVDTGKIEIAHRGLIEKMGDYFIEATIHNIMDTMSGVGDDNQSTVL